MRRSGPVLPVVARALAAAQGTMPCIVKLLVAQARNLPVMDRASSLTDAYVEVCAVLAAKPAHLVRVMRL